MKKLLVCSEQDIPSANMRDCLLDLTEWEETCSCEDGIMLKSDEMYMLSSERWHVDFDDVVDVSIKMGVNPELIIFMSRHSSKSERPTLTVHPLGNYHGNDLGGLPEKLVESAPHHMSETLRRISSINDIGNTEVAFEVTHHGPWLDRPTFFIEVGSNEEHWKDRHAAEILAKALMENGESDYPAVIGIGGGHYAPRFTESALSRKVDFGHMIPNYHLEDSDDEDIARMVRDACEATDTKIIFLHRKSMKGKLASRIRDVSESEGFEVTSSSDFDLINQ